MTQLLSHFMSCKGCFADYVFGVLLKGTLFDEQNFYSSTDTTVREGKKNSQNVNIEMSKFLALVDRFLLEDISIKLYNHWFQFRAYWIIC